MATAANYNEVEHAAGTSPSSKDYNCMDPLYKWDTRYPDRLSRMQVTEEGAMSSGPERRSGRRLRNRNAARFKTQPITFDEIQEVDEDNAEDAIASLKDQFTAFSKSMDGLIPSPRLPTATTEPASSPDSGTSTNASGPSAALLAGMAQHERCRSRRHKRRAKRGIQEVPEMEQEKEPGEGQAG